MLDGTARPKRTQLLLRLHACRSKNKIEKSVLQVVPAIFFLKKITSLKVFLGLDTESFELAITLIVV